jgi:hypothetical protein
MIKDIINKDFPDEKYNCKYLNRTSGLYEYVHKTASEIEPATSVEVGFKSENPSDMKTNGGFRSSQEQEI